MTDRVDYNDDGDLDDIVVNDVTLFRMERMYDNSFWIRCYRDDKHDVVFWLNSKGKIAGSHEVEET